MILRDLQSHTKTKCGWASLKSVIDKKLEDRMESFALSETFKYLFLLFDEENVLHQELKDSNFVFTTEGHVLALDSKYLHNGQRQKKTGDEDQWQAMSSEQQIRMKNTGGQEKLEGLQPSALHIASRKQRSPQCPVYKEPNTFLKSIPYRSDADFARQMVGTRPDVRDVLELDPKGFCEKPSLEVERVIVEFSGPPKKTYLGNGGHGHTISASGSKESIVDRQSREQQEEENMSKKLVVIPIKKGVFVNRIVGVRMQLQYDGVYNGYRAVKIENHPLSLNSNVYVDRSSMRPLWDSYQLSQDAHLRIHKAVSNAASAAPTVAERDLSIKPAAFGYWNPFVVDYSQDEKQGNSFETALGNESKGTSTASPAGNTSQGQIETAALVRILENVSGCRPYTSSQSKRIRDKILVVDRGLCLFILKAYYAQAAGARSIVVINSDEEAFAMAGGPEQPANPSSDDNGPQIESEGAPPSSQPNLMGEGIPVDDIDIHSVMVGFSEGQILLDWIQEVETHKGETPATIVGGFVQRKITKEQIETARLSYNNLPIVNIQTITTAIATYG